MFNSFNAAVLTILATVSVSPARPLRHFQLKKAETRTMTDAAIGKERLTAGKVSADKKTVTYSVGEIYLVVTTGPEDDMLSFRIQGLRNPTLSIPEGSTLHVLFVNSDDDMRHDIRFADQLPPYEVNADLKGSVGSRALDHRSKTALHVERMVLAAPSVPGAHAYVCDVPGHAKGGMFGRIVVR